MLPVEISGHSIIAGAIVGTDRWLILAEGWRNGLVYVVASYNDGESEWFGGRYFDGPNSQMNRETAREHFAAVLANYWSS